MPDTRALRLRLSLNPTRYVAHQKSRQFAGLPVAAWDLPPPMMYRRRLLRATRLEAILDDNDNALLTGAAQAHGRPEAWPMHVSRYWAGVISEIGAALQQAAGASGVTVQRVADHLNLQSVETYWEFTSADPTALVRELEPHLFELGGMVEARDYDYPHGERVAGRTHNARLVRVRLRPGVQLRVYAKTTARIRFEIAHDLPKLAPARYVAHTSSDLADLSRWIDVLAADAADEVNRVLERLEEVTFFPAGSLPPYNLVQRISAALPDRTSAETAISLVINNGVIRLAPGDPLRPTVEALQRYGVLVRQGRAAFVVAPLFRRAVTELRGHRRHRVQGP